VLLRPYVPSDAPAFFAAVEESRDRLMQWDSWPQRYRTLANVQKLIAYYQADFILRQQMEISIWERDTMGFLGSIMLRPKDWAIPFFEIGYWLRTTAEGQGYMREAAQLVIDFAFDHLNAQRMMLRIDARNKRSLVLAQRLGFVREGCLRRSERTVDGMLRDMVIMALIPTDRV
jgi:RimJ/RimL family protein N-acetyltransferase